MSNGAYKQEKINKDKPFKSEPIIIANILIEIKQNKSGGTEIFFKQRESDDYIVLKEINGYQTILIITNSKIVFYLPNDNKYRWSDQYDGITTKKSLKKFYGGVKYEGEIEKEEILISHYYYDFSENCSRSVKASPGYTKMLYYAKLNEHGMPGTTHEFNLNIDLRQEDGTWMPITIDPIMKNPPPIIPKYYKHYYGIGNEN